MLTTHTVSECDMASKLNYITFDFTAAASHIIETLSLNLLLVHVQEKHFEAGSKFFIALNRFSSDENFSISRPWPFVDFKKEKIKYAFGVLSSWVFETHFQIQFLKPLRSNLPYLATIYLNNNCIFESQEISVVWFYIKNTINSSLLGFFVEANFKGSPIWNDCTQNHFRLKTTGVVFSLFPFQNSPLTEYHSNTRMVLNAWSSTHLSFQVDTQHLLLNLRCLNTYSFSNHFICDNFLSRLPSTCDILLIGEPLPQW